MGFQADDNSPVCGRRHGRRQAHIDIDCFGCVGWSYGWGVRVECAGILYDTLWGLLLIVFGLLNLFSDTFYTHSI